MAIGRRKNASARVRLKPGTGVVTVNGRPLDAYLAREVLVMLAKQPFDVTDTVNRFDIRARCRGGGLTGQAGALRLGIARALVELDEKYRPVLRKYGLLTRDAREVERKKYGRPGARKRFQFSKRSTARAGTPFPGRVPGVSPWTGPFSLDGPAHKCTHGRGVPRGPHGRAFFRDNGYSNAAAGICQQRTRSRRQV